MNVPNAEQRSL